MYCLDLTHPEVVEYIDLVFSTLVKFGFGFFKVDFLSAGMRRGNRWDASKTRVQAYRQGLYVLH